MITVKPKFEIGQEVSDGFICAIYIAKFYVLTSPSNSYDIWTKEDPKWLDKFIYSIKLNNPIRSMTFDDLQNSYPDLDYTIIEEKYNSMPLYHYISKIEEMINE